jgi:acetyl esterase/lipase
MLICPCLDDRHSTASSRAITDARTWNHASSVRCWAMYLGDGHDGDVSPYAAPSRAEDLTDLPSTYLSIGDLDLMRDETIEYATRLTRAGVPTELHLYPGAFHGFEERAPAARISVDSREDQIRALRRALRPVGTHLEVGHARA